MPDELTPSSDFFTDVRGILAGALTAEFGSGFSYANLRKFRQFYLTFLGEEEICYSLRSKLRWTHNRLIEHRLKKGEDE